VLYTVSLDSSEKVKWVREIDKVVERAVISDLGRVALVYSDATAITLITASPSEDRSYQLKSLLNQQDIDRHVPASKSHLHWYNRQTRFDCEGDKLTVALDWGGTFAVSMK